MLPEEKARLDIDRRLQGAGWEVVDRKHYSPTLSAVAITEGILKVILELIICFYRR